MNIKLSDARLVHILIIAATVAIALNTFMTFGIAPTGRVASKSVALTGDALQDAINIVIPTGTPAVYGSELGVSFDDPLNSLNIISQLDPAYGSSKVFTKDTASNDEWGRYIEILTTPTITCEFCCGATTAVRSDGSPACGCQHVWAMRGLTAYLLRNHPDMSNDEIMTEVARWKALFFPKDMTSRFLVQTKSGEYTPDMAALIAGVDSAVVKNFASGDIPAASSIQDMPGMVGGC